MPYETRRISLSDDELLQAVQLFQLDYPSELPYGDLVACRIHEGHIEATLRPDRNSPVRSVAHFPPALAVRALVHFCIKENIPLPLHSDKTFCTENERATLRIELVTGRAARTEAAVSAYAAERHRQPLASKRKEPVS